MRNDETIINSTSNYPAHAVGIGGGTLLVLLANNLPDNYIYKSWFMIIAPTCSIFISTSLTWLKNQIQNTIKKRNIEKSFLEIKKRITEALNNPLTSEEHKKELKMELEAIEKLQIETIKAKIKDK